MKVGDIQVLLAASNRWWRDPEGWARGDPNLRAAAAAPFSYRAGALNGLIPGGCTYCVVPGAPARALRSSTRFLTC